MAYDERLAERIRELLVAEADVTEKKMFGGLAFLVGGHLAVAASRSGGLLARVDPDDHDRLVRTGKATPMVMRDRPMQGWLQVDAQAVATNRQLAPWVGRATTYVRALPPKR